jgi:hypothetical protein
MNEIALMKKQTTESIESQIFTLEKLLENQPKVIDGKWNQKHFSLTGKIKQLKKKLKDADKVTPSESWLKYLSK